MNINIAICYWGLTRSTKHVYKSHYDYLFNILKSSNINYDIFMHTWKTDNNFISIKENTVPIDYEEYKLLEPDYYVIECQQDFINTLEFSNYFNKELFEKYGDSEHEWYPQLIMNHLCALESQKRVYNMAVSTNKKYDYVIFVRPDVLICDSFNINMLHEDFDIIIPNEDHNEGFNDRFAILLFNNASMYARRIDEIIEFRKNNGRIVSEKYVKFIINKYYNNLKFINFKMRRARPDGEIIN
jgi:hypothetical protein